MAHQKSTSETLNTLPNKVEFAYKLGHISYEIGKEIDFNPYNRCGVEKSHLANAWKMGWQDACEGIGESHLQNEAQQAE